MDERTVAYVMDAQRPFADLRQAIAQVSGWLVLAALRTGDAVGDHPALTQAEALVSDAIGAVRDLRATPPARAHQDGLLHAGRALEAAILDARTAAHVRTDADVRRISTTVKAAYAHLTRAAAVLPGFELVSFAHACCNQESQITNQEFP